MSAEKNAVLLLAAGSGTRMQGTIEDKILAPLHGRPVFSHSFRAFAESDLIHTICIVYRDEAQKRQLHAALDTSAQAEVLWVRGGRERQDSVLSGLRALPADTGHTLIHDCARPLISADLIDQLIETSRSDGASCLAHPVTDTIKRIPSADQIEQTELEDLQRDRLWAMETPQAFSHAAILKAYEHVAAENVPITDDCAAAASIGIKTTLIPNPNPNPKITTRADLDYINYLLDARS